MNWDMLAAKNYGIQTRDILHCCGLARLERLLRRTNSCFAGLLSMFFSNNNWFFITFPENAEALAAQLSSGVNANNFFSSFFIVNIVLAVFNLIPAFPWMEACP
jgi:Zn-dependent protease